MDERKTKCVQALLDSSKSPKRHRKKPKIFQIPESSALSRVRQFLPEIEAANRDLPDSTTDNPIVNVVPADCSSQSDEEDDDQKENGTNRGALSSATVEMNLALYEYSSSSSDSDSNADSEAESGNAEGSERKQQASGTSSDDDGKFLSGKTLRLRKEKSQRKPHIEEIQADEKRTDEPDTTT